MNEFRQWFAQQPFSTKWISVFSLILPLMMKFYLISPHWLVWHSESILWRFQWWRMFTSPFLYGVNFNFIIALYFRFQYSLYLETGYFVGRSADYLYFLLMSTLALNVLNFLVGMASLWESFSMVIVYVWAMNNRQVIVNFMFGIKFPAVYLPAILGLLQFLLSADLFGPLFGIIVGHLYYFLTEIYEIAPGSGVGINSQRGGVWKRRLMAPNWLKAVVPNYSSLGGGSYQGFTVQRPEEAFGGRANVAGQAKSGASAMKEKDDFKVFGGKGQKLGS